MKRLELEIRNWNKTKSSPSHCLWLVEAPRHPRLSLIDSLAASVSSTGLCFKFGKMAFQNFIHIDLQGQFMHGSQGLRLPHRSSFNLHLWNMPSFPSDLAVLHTFTPFYLSLYTAVAPYRSHYASYFLTPFSSFLLYVSVSMGGLWISGRQKSCQIGGIKEEILLYFSQYYNSSS